MTIFISLYNSEQICDPINYICISIMRMMVHVTMFCMYYLRACRTHNSIYVECKIEFGITHFQIDLA